MRHLLGERRKSEFSVRRDLSRQLKASDIYFVTFVTHGIVEERQMALASLTQDEIQRKKAQKQRRQQSQDAIRAKYADIVRKVDLSGACLRSRMLSSNSFTSE